MQISVLPNPPSTFNLTTKETRLCQRPPFDSQDLSLSGLKLTSKVGSTRLTYSESEEWTLYPDYYYDQVPLNPTSVTQ